MEQNGVGTFRHRRSPSSDRFLGVFSPTKQGSVLADSIAGDELNEDDVFWTGDFTEPHGRTTSPSSLTNIRHPFRQPEKFGILAALSDDNLKPNQPLLQRKSSLSPTTSPFLHKPLLSASPTQSTPFSQPIPSIPKPHNLNSYSQSMPARKFQHSAPVNVPIMARNVKKGSLADVDIDDDDPEDEMLPPHEIVARGSAARSPKTTFSVLEGAGRTLKGRDLRQVRNAVWRQTGGYQPTRYFHALAISIHLNLKQPNASNLNLKQLNASNQICHRGPPMSIPTENFGIKSCSYKNELYSCFLYL